MKKSEFIQSLKEKSTSALFDLLKIGQSGEQKIDPDFLTAIIDELYSRELSETESKEFENILDLNVDKDFYNPSESKSHFSFDEKKEIFVKNDNAEQIKYIPLKIMANMIKYFSYILIICGIIASLYFVSIEEQYLLGIAALLVMAVVAFPLLALSNLIYVFIDIEYNTRKISEEIRKKESK